MLRRAVIQHLKANVPSFGGQVYQGFLAPHNVQPPYATVKTPTGRGSPMISYAGTQPIEVRIYNDQSSFVGLELLERAVIEALNGQEIVDQDDGEHYFLEWVPGGGDFVDEEKKLIGRLVMFEAALLFEPV